MRVEIFDVGHGQCAVIAAPNGRRMMIDCGDRWREETFWTGIRENPRQVAVFDHPLEIAEMIFVEICQREDVDDLPEVE
jgi:hypothetical protein